MKKIFLFIAIFCFTKIGICQYTIGQNIGSNVTLLNIGPANGGAIKGGIIPMSFTDTTAANSSPIAFYTGATIWSTSDTSIYVRNKTAFGSYWFKIGGAGAGGAGQFWPLGYRQFPVIYSAFPPKIGTGAVGGADFTIGTNGIDRLVFLNAGINRSAGAANKYLMMDTVTKYLYYGDGGTTGSFWSLTGNSGTTAGTNFLGTTDNIDLVFKRNSVESGRFSASGNLNLGLTGTTLGSLGFSGNTSGLITIKGQAVADTYNFNLPTTAGTSGQVLTTQGGGASPMIWTNPVSSLTTKWFETSYYNSTTGVLNIPKDQRVGLYLNIGKTYTRMKPYIMGTVLLGLGNSWISGVFSGGTPYMTQLGTYYGKTVNTASSVLGADLNMLQATAYAFGTFGNDTTTFVDITGAAAWGLCTSGQPVGGTIYYNDHPNSPQLTKSKNYIYGTYHAFIANHYLDNDWFSVASLADANFRDAVASDSLYPKSSVGSIGLGAFTFTKPAGKTSLVIGTYGADSTRCRQGTITITLDGVTVYSRYFNGLNDGNKGNGLIIKAGLNYEAIVLQNLSSAAQTVIVTASGDSTRFDYIGYLKPKETAVRPLYISNIGYGSGTGLFVIPLTSIDTANQMLQNAVTDFIDYPVFIQNTNNWLDSSINVGTPTVIHLTSSGNDSVAKAYIANIIPISYSPVNNAAWTQSGNNTSYFLGNVGIGTTPSTKLDILSTTEQLRLRYDASNYLSTTISSAGVATINPTGNVINWGGGTTATETRFLEPSGSGTNYTAFKAVAQGANITYSLPATVGGAGTFLRDAAGNGVLDWASAGSGITIGTTTITSGTNTKVLYNNSGVVGEYTVTGSGNVVLATSPTIGNFTFSGAGTSGVASITNSNYDLIIGNSLATATFRLLPFGSDIYFDNPVAGSTYFRSNSVELAILAAASTQLKSTNVTITSLAGTGSRAVLADASGVLSAPVSDRTMKKNITDIEDGIGKIMKLRPVSFYFKDEWKNFGERQQLGFIAQEVEKVLPNSVFINTAEGKIKGKMGYNETDIIPLLVSAIQTQQKQIDDLQKQINDLKKKQK